MNMKYQPVIGLEIHVQANTKSKMFSREGTDYFGNPANTFVDTVSLGLPGALPVPNQAAIDQITKLSLALNCKINQYTRFDRKNYFYPDLPKGYQITQYDYPIGYEGFLEVDMGDDAKRIRIRRIHMEEDTGKSIHGEESNTTLLDYNKSGMPLMEIVTEPDFETIEEVSAFAKLLKQTIEYLGVSEAEMQKGQMRFELNISLRTDEPAGKLPDYRVEVKNIGSISVLEKVIEYEVERQTMEIDAGRKLQNETRGLKDMSGETLSQRVKETEDDYRYFPEPDIPPFHLSDEYLDQIQGQIGELPAARRNRYISELGLEHQQADILVDQPDKGDWIDEFYKQTKNKELAKEASKWLGGEITGYIEQSEYTLANMPVTIADLAYLLTEMQTGKLSGSIVKKVLAKQFENGGSAEQIVKEKNLVLVQDDSILEEWVEQAIAENPDIVDRLDKNPNVIKALVGKVMGMSRGKASAPKVEEMLKDKLNVS